MENPREGRRESSSKPSLAKGVGSPAKVFISYRRDGGAEMARLTRDALQRRGYRVFMDVEDLRRGPFNTALFAEIESATDMVVVLTPGCLDRCSNPNDWVRLEVAHAIKQNKNVVPVMTRNFSWPRSLPEDLAALPTLEGVPPSHEYFEASMDKLAKLLVGQPQSQPRRHLTGPMVAALVVVALVCIAVAFFAGPWSGRKALPPTSPTSSHEPVRPVRPQPVDEANRLFDAKDYSNAFHAFVQASDADLNDVSLHRKIEDCARRGKLTEQFLDRYRTLVEKNPDSAILHNYLGNALLLLDPNDSDGKAQEQYQAALGLDGQFSPPLMNLGIIAFRKGRHAEAEDLFGRYLQLNPQDAVGWTDLGMLHAARVEADANDQQAIDKGLLALDKAIGLDPGLAFAHKGRGRIMAATDRKAEALKAYQRSLALDYEQPDVRRQFELLTWDIGTDRVIAGGRDDLQTRSIQGAKALSIMQALDQGQFDQAEKASRELIRADPENALVWRLLAKALDGQGRSDEAAEAGERATRLAATTQRVQ